MSELDRLLGITSAPAPSASGLSFYDMPRSNWSAGWRSGVSGLQEGMGHIGQALLGMDNEEFLRRKQAEQEFYARNAPGTTTLSGPGGVMDGGKISDWLAFNLAQSAPSSLPLMAAGGVGGLAGRALLGGAARAFGKDAIAAGAERALAGQAEGAITGAMQRKALEDATRQVATRYGAMTGAAAGDAPVALGDILGSQHETGKGYNVPAALAGTVPYVAADVLLGGEGALLKAGTGGLERAAKTGLMPSVLDYGKRVGRTMAEEGTAEVGQDVINQTFGKMAVDPSISASSMTSPEFLKQAAETFITAGVMGGVMGAPAHLFSKPKLDSTEAVADRVMGLKTALEDISRGNKTALEVKEANDAEAERVAKEQAAKEAPPPRLGYSPLAGTPIVFPDGSVTLNGEQELQKRYAPQDAPFELTGGDGSPAATAEAPVEDPIQAALNKAQMNLFTPGGGPSKAAKVATENQAVPPVKPPTFASMQEAYMSVLPKLLEQAVAGNHITPAEAAWHAEDFAQVQNKKQFEAAKAKFEEALNGTRPNTTVLPPNPTPTDAGAPDAGRSVGVGDGAGHESATPQGTVPAAVLEPATGNPAEVSGNAVTQPEITNGQETSRTTNEGQNADASKGQGQENLLGDPNADQQSEPAISATQPTNQEKTSEPQAKKTFSQTEGQQQKTQGLIPEPDSIEKWKAKLGERVTSEENVGDFGVTQMAKTSTEIAQVTDAMQTVLDAKLPQDRAALMLSLNYLAGVEKDNKHLFGSSEDLQHIPDVAKEFLNEQEDIATAAGSPVERLIGRARDRAKTSLDYVINRDTEIKKTDAQKSAELTKAANAVDAGQTLETEFDPSAPFDYGPEVTKELALKDDAIEVLQRRSDAEPDNTKLAAGLVNARQQRNEFARTEQRRIESERKAAALATTAAGEEITPDMEAEIAARKEATLERQARRLEMGTKGVDIATSNMKPGHLTSLLEHYGIDVSKGVTSEARKTLQTNLRRDVAAYLKDGPEAVPVEIRGAIKAATEDKKGEVRYSKVPKTAAERSTAAEVEADLKDFMKSGSLGRNVTVVQDAGALPPNIVKSVSVDDTTQAFVHNGHAYVIAGNIAKGNARAVFLHDVGGHLGLENMLTKNQHRMLVDMVKKWAARTDNSQEHRFAKAALERVASAQTEDSQIGNETIAYFIEEAVQGGVNPTADNFKSELGRWFRVLWAAFKGAIRKLGMNPDKMTAQDVVDMAYGAARMEVHGTWHGTAAEFRKFNHEYMGTGEGAQVRGWGSYLAQRAGIGKGYWSDDVKRKNPESWRQGRLAQYQDPSIRPSLEKLGARISDNAQKVADYAQGASMRATNHIPKVLGYMSAARFSQNYHEALLSDVLREVQTKALGPEDITADAVKAAVRTVLDRKPAPKIEGNLMRVDVNVADNEWLDLDKLLSTQPDILAKVMKGMPESMQEAVVEEANQDIAEMDGETLYKALEFVESRDSLVSEQFPVDEYNKTLANAESKQVVSTYLDSLGIKGNKFLDQPSRTVRDTTVTYNGVTKTGSEWWAEARKAFDSKDYEGTRIYNLLRAIARQGMAATRDDINAGIERHKDNPHYTEFLQQKTWLDTNESKITIGQGKDAITHNFVVFNDKNIQRVASLKGADREKVQFSKAIPADRVEMAHKYGGTSGVQVVADTAYTVRKIGDWITPLPDLIRKYGVKGKLPTVKEWYAAIQAKEEERNRIKQKAEAVAKIIEPLSNDQRGLLNELGYDSTFQQKWGYDPKFERLNKDGKMEPVKVTVDPEMKARFDKMEKDHPEVIKALKKMFAYGEEVRQDLRSVLRASGLSDSFIVANQLEGPYMPLRRFGNFAVVLKSDKLIAAEKAAEGTTPSSEASKLVDKLKMNADDFAFSRFETAGQAAVFLREQLATGKFNKDKKFSNTFPYGDELNTMTTIPQDVLQRVMAHIKADENMDSDAKKAMVENVKDIYRQTTEDRLARQAQQRRKYRHGADTDMIRSFMAQSEADAGFLSLLKHGGTINDAIYQVQREGEESRQDLKAISDLIIAHHTEIQKVKNTPIQDRLVAGTSAMQLASSPSYHLSNMSQVFMVTMPKLAAVFNDYGGSYKAIMEGYKLYREITGGNIITGKTLDLENMKPGPLKDVLLHAVRRNLLDVGMDGDISQFNKFQTGYAVADGTSAVASKALYKLRQVSRGVELMNRIATVAASYNMYMERHKGDANAVANAQAFALEMTETTQGDMSNVAAPLALKLTPKVIGQYRKYQIMMVMFYADGFNKAFRSADPAERAVGRRMLAYKLFHTGMAAGVLGLPMINIVGPLFASLLGDDDEPKDFERMMRDTIGNQALADLLLHGPLQMMGLDASAKLGDEKVFSIMPFTDIDISSKKGLALTTMGLIGGPAFGQASKMADGLGLMQQGAYYKGIEKMLPKGLEDAFKGFRLANEGYTIRSGNVMVTPEDINGVAIAFQMMGLPSTDIKRMQWFQSQQIEIKKFYADREADLKRDYLDAKKSGDATQEIKDDWRQVQEGKAKVRKYFNDVPTEMKARDMSALTDVVESQQKAELKLQKSIPAASSSR